MPQLDHTGPEGKGPKTGRELGLYKKEFENSAYKLGQGMGLKRKSDRETGLGKRLRSSKLFNNK